MFWELLLTILLTHDINAKLSYERDQENIEYTTIKTETSIVKFSPRFPSILYYGINNDTHVTSNQHFNVTLLSLQEISGRSYVGPPVSLLNLPYVVSTSIQQQLDYSEYGRYYYYDYTDPNSPLAIVNYTIPNVGGFIFQVFPKDLHLGGSNDILMKMGTVKFSMFLIGWNFLDPIGGKLRLSANISVDEGMYSCSLKVPNLTNETVITCDSSELFGTLNLLNYALSIDPQTLSSSRLDVNVSKMDVLFEDGANDHKEFYSSDYDITSTQTANKHECNDYSSAPKAKIETLQVFLDVQAFRGLMFYDPEISVLFTGSQSSGHNGCGSSDSHVDWVLTYLSFSFLGLALLIFLSVSLISMYTPIRNIVLGKEGSRIERSRQYQRRSERESQIMGNSPADIDNP